MSLVRRSTWKSLSRVRPWAGGAPEPSFGLMPFIEAHASIIVPSTLKCSVDRRRFTFEWASTAARNDAAAMMLGENATAEQLAGLRARLGLDAPVAAQYGRWLAALLHGDLGTSLRTGLPVAAMLVPALGRSLLVAFLSITLMLLVAVPLG